MVRLALASLLVLAACKGKPSSKTEEPAPSAGSGSATPAPVKAAVAGDPHSLSNPDQIAVDHLSLALKVDFTTKVLTGDATLRLVKRDPAARELVLDTEGLTISKVTDCASKQALSFALGEEVKRLGRPLTITPASDCVVVSYASAPTAKALLWVEPAGTAGKTQPMLFTQSQAILARTWIPLQDSPGVRFTYDASIEVPAGVRPVMSAENPEAAGEGGRWAFTMPQRIPSYLMALAVGDFTFKAIGPRTGVWAEPSVVEAAADEFAEVEQMMTVGEQLYGPYRWGRYDILVLPPSFPFGGMENPRLTFLTPTVIVGDRSLVSLIAHELAHSWSGNLVTNSTWNDLWLNEGFTTYVERRIMEALRGKEVADMGWAMGRKDLDEVLVTTTKEGTDTRLALDYKRGSDPEDGPPSDIAYEKGALFLRALEQELGRDTFDAFMKARFDRLAFQSTDTKTFEADIHQIIGNRKLPWTLADWLHANGLPPAAPPSTSAQMAALEAQAIAFAKDGTLPDARAWKTVEWTAFLRGIPKDVPAAHLTKLDAKFQLTRSNNALIAMRWLPLLVAADVREAAPAVEAYLVRVGRRWLVGEVYRALVDKNDYWKGVAKQAFAKAKAGYHPVTRDSMATVVGASPG